MRAVSAAVRIWGASDETRRACEFAATATRIRPAATVRTVCAGRPGVATRAALSVIFRSLQSPSVLVTVLLAARQAHAAPSVVTINRDQALLIDGQKVFPIGFTMPPPPDGVTPGGKNALEELHDAGANFLRTGPFGKNWTAATLTQELKWQDAAARHGMHCLVNLRDLARIGPGDTARETLLRQVVNRLKDHPGLGVWKSVDEPEWGNVPLPPLLHARQIIRELDHNHPIEITQAPRGTVATLRPYNAACDIVGADIYPVGYPPGTHSLLPNKEISMVGDYTRTMMEVAGGHMPVWMTLQIAWSGVVKPGQTLRFPTFPQERFMCYQAIINGARGLIFFGGQIPAAMTAADAKLGWNWSFWNRVLRPVVEEIGDHSPLHPALVAPNSPLAVQATPAVEYCVREAGDDLFLLACRREGATVKVAFSGLPAWARRGEVLYESPRTVAATGGQFTDWFGPFDVHVYRFHHTQAEGRWGITKAVGSIHV